MANLDELQIQITASSKEADSAIQSLTSSLNNLNRAIEGLNTSKINSFANAMGKLTNIGVSTNTTSKAIKEMAGDLANTFNIRTKKGIQDITTALQGLYEAEKLQRKDSSPMTTDMYLASLENIQQAIKANYTYRQELDDSTKKVREFLKAQKDSGVKIGFKNVAGNFQKEDIKQLNRDLGGILDPKHTGAEEGFKELDEFLRELKEFSGANIDTYDISQGILDVQKVANEAKSSVLDFGEALKQGVIDLDSIDKATDRTAKSIESLYAEQEKYGATNGLGSLIGVFQQISNIKMPDFNGMGAALKEMNANPPTQTAKAVSDIGDAAQKATSQVESLTDAIRQSTTVIEGNEVKEHGFTMKDAPQYQNVEYPPMVVEQAQAFEEKLLPAIIDTENEISNLYQHMMSLSSVEAVYDAIT